jgi:biopolymer transport protein TolQ
MNDLSVFELIRDASVIVQLVMLLLLAASVTSWMIILRKRSELNKTRADADKFEEEFWAGGDLNAMYRRLEVNKGTAHGVATIFESGFREFGRMRQHGAIGSDQIIEGSRRAMRAALLKETDRLEKSLSMLATIGSTSPYVGLFGTVWGIMSAFHGLGNAAQVTLAQVAPGISEALVATAMGLFAAIPAVLAYNKFSARAENLMSNYQTFAEEFSAILHRQVHSK